jgi:hypothetical protein
MTEQEIDQLIKLLEKYFIYTSLENKKLVNSLLWRLVFEKEGKE